MKYMGSKNRISKYIIPIILEKHKKENIFVDIFCGGCNLIDKINVDKRLANDKNKFLISMWNGLMENLDRPREISKDLYTRARNEYNKNINDEFSDFLIGWIGWMGSYNGRFFDGGYSGHCVGKTKRDYISEQIKNTEKQIEKLKGVKFISKDYKDIKLKSKATIYCDPPYKGTKKYSTSKNFNHDEFWEWCRYMSIKGHDIFISEYNAPRDFKCLWEKEITNSLNNKKTYKPIEKLFTI